MREFGAACADQPDETDDLAGAQGQIDVLVLALARQAGGFDHDRRIADVASGDSLVEPLARHQFRQPRLGHASGVVDADQSSVAQNGDAARHVEHLREPMTDKDDGDARGGERAHDGEQVVRLGLCERGGRLVHEDEFGVARERACDRHQLSAGNWQTPERRAEVELHAELRERGACGPAYGAVVHEPRRAHKAVEGDVLGDRHFRKKRQVLPDHRHPLAAGELRRRRCDALAEIVDARAGRRLVDAGDDLDQRALAAAVLAGEAMHFPAPDRKRHVVERAHAAEADRHVLEADRLGGGNRGIGDGAAMVVTASSGLSSKASAPPGAGLPRFRGRGRSVRARDLRACRPYPC